MAVVDIPSTPADGNVLVKLVSAIADTDVTINGQNPLYQPFDWILTGSGA